MFNVWRSSLRFFCLSASLFTVAAQGQTAPFTITPATSAITLYPGTSQTLQVQSSGTSPAQIQVTLSGLPVGVTASQLQLAPGGTGTITLTAAVAADTPAFLPTAPTTPNAVTTSVALTGVSGPYTATAPLNLTISLSNAGFAPQPSALNLQVLRINTNGVAVTSKTVDVPGTISITSADGSTTYLPGSSDTDDTATFHVHGNTTAEMPKLPYDMKLGTSVDLLSLLGITCPYVTSSGKEVCDKSKSYILLANYDDKSLLRDWSASALANAIPLGNGYLTSPAGSPTPSGTSQLMPWAPHSTFVEVYLNGAYEGNYQLIEEVKVDTNRVNIPEMTDTDVSGDSLTGGYLLEIDQHQDEDFVFDTPQGLPIGLIDPDFSPEVPQQTSYISDYVDTAENALFSSNYTSTTEGWRAYFDEASLVNWYIVNDVMGNVDGGDFYSSDYFYKTVDNPLLYMGPIWDFDISAGNVNYEPIFSPTVPWAQTQAVWYKQLFTDAGFKADVVQQFNLLKTNGVFSTWLASIQQQGTALTQSAQNNFSRWPILGETVWPNMVAQGSYQGEVSNLINWISTRIAWLDSQFNNKTMSAATIVSGSSSSYVGAPVTYDVQVTGTSGTPTGAVTLTASNEVLGTAQLDSTGHATLTGIVTATGNYNVVAIYNGDSTFSLAQSASVPLTVSAAPVATNTVVTEPSMTYTQGSTFLFTATVTNQTSSTVPTGGIDIIYNGAKIGYTALNNGVATISVPQSISAGLSPGAYTLGFTYTGDAAHSGSSSNATINVTSPSGATAAPVLTLESVAGGHAISITDSQAGAVLYYTTDGSYPTTSSAVYSGPIALTQSVTVQALAVAPSFAPSPVVTATFQSPSSISAPNGFAGNTSLVLNGSALINGTALQLTNSGASQAGSAWLATQVSAQNFTTDFTFQMVNPQDGGLTFTLQGQGTQAIGSPGCGLGYGACPGQAQAIPNSIAFKFDIFNDAGEGTDSFGLYANGAAPTVPSIDLTSTGLNLRSGDPFHVHMTYDGSTLQVSLTDTITGKSVSGSFSGNIPGLLGTSSVFAGFTAGSAGSGVTADILNWTYTSN